MKSKTLTVVIPYYKEKEDDIFPLLSSLNNQVGADFNEFDVILVNDGVNNKLDKKFLDLFKNLEIKTVLMKENRGPGVARQVGLDNATGEYVMFCDADDILQNVAVISLFLQEIHTNHPDIITSQWVEENKVGDKLIYITHEDEATWMHGKAFRRLFLQTKGIKFHNELKVHEDSYFLAIAFACTDNVRKIQFTTYVWKFVEDSITRRNNAIYTFDSFVTFLNAISMSMEEIAKVNPEVVVQKIVQLLMYTYFTVHSALWAPDDKAEYREQVTKTFFEILEKFKEYFNACSDEMLVQLYNAERAKPQFAGYMEEETIRQWFDKNKLS